MSKERVIKILDVGPGPEEHRASNPEELFGSLGELDIETMDFDPDNKPTYVHDISEPIFDRHIEQYDVVLCSHVLEHIDRSKIMVALINLAKMVKVGGELWLVVPSLEWAAREILSNRESVHVQGVLYGGQRDEYDYHKVGFTLITIRQLVETIGLIVRQAHQSVYKAHYQDGDFEETAVVPHNEIIALKISPIVEKKAEDAISVNTDSD